MSSRSAIDGSGANMGGIATYLTGFVLSLILTAIPFSLVMSGALPASLTIFGVFSAGILQILVHLHYFLHLDRSSVTRWNGVALWFTLVLIILFVGGSLWIMYDLNERMM